MTEESALQMRWHRTGKRYSEKEGQPPKTGHPANGRAWKAFDRAHPEVASDARNVKIAIATDGFNLD